jgi:hypothetical protein
MEKTSTHPNTLIIETKKADGSQNTSIKLPLGILHFGVKLLKLLPASVKEKINKELTKNGLGVSFESLLEEGHKTLIDTLQNIEIDLQDDKQKIKLSVV